MGDSLKQRGRTVAAIIKNKFPVSARVGGISVLVALCVGIPLGCIAAIRRGKFVDSFISVVATCGIAVPSFVICTVLMYFLGVKLKVLPTLGLTSWKHYIMPVIALAFYPTAYIMRLTRSSMLYWGRIICVRQGQKVCHRWLVCLNMLCEMLFYLLLLM